MEVVPDTSGEIERAGAGHPLDFGVVGKQLPQAGNIAGIHSPHIGRHHGLVLFRFRHVVAFADCAALLRWASIGLLPAWPQSAIP
jgi:hypothetical protein